MANVCLKCKFSEVSEFDSPCTTCSYDAKADKWSNFTPYKGLNEMLRERLGYPTSEETVVHDTTSVSKGSMEAKCGFCVNFEKPWNEEPCRSCIEHDADGSTERLNFVPKDSVQNMHDPVSKPSHYMLKPGLEVRDVIELLLGKIYEADPQPNAPLFISDYVQLMQYLMRFMDKNGVEDLRKASWYLDKMIEAYDGDS